jgi:exopolysaccharide biosynthesis polyprenyl glycosylphosphotransferase
MLKQHNRLLIALHVVSDSLLGILSFLAAYQLRFFTGLIPVTKGTPPLANYLYVLPFIAGLVPLAFQLQGLYRLRRGRSRVDDFFAVFVGSILAVVFGIVGTLYVQTYYATGLRTRGVFEVSQMVWGIFLVLNTAATYGSRELVRQLLERRWRAGIGLKRILIAGSGELGRLVADKIIEHREFGYQIVGFVDDRAIGDHLGYRGLPLLGTIDEAAEIAAREAIDHLYVALPPEQHLRMIELIESTALEMLDVKVVPDLLQVIALRARLEDLDGVPVININDVPLQGFNSIVKRAIDVVLSAAALLVLAVPLGLIALLVRITSRGPVLYRQDRMGLDGKSFSIVKFRSMHDDAERETGPVWAQKDDPRVTPLGAFLRKSNLDELPQLWNVLRGDMSLVGPRPEVSRYVDLYRDRYAGILSMRPGITDLASLAYRHEETILSAQPDPERYYREVVLPAKLNLAEEYVGRQCLALDALILVRTFVTAFHF